MFKAKAPYLVMRDNIGPELETHEFYLEKLHIWERNSSKPLKQILFLIYRGSMFFLFLHKAIFYMQPLSIFTDIDQIFACDMSHSKTKAGGNILFDVDDSELDLCDRISICDPLKMSVPSSPGPLKPVQPGDLRPKSARQSSKSNSKMKHRFICIQLK